MNLKIQSYNMVEQTCEYLNISRSTFDKMIKEGKIPKGKKRLGFKELSWTKEQLSSIKN